MFANSHMWIFTPENLADSPSRRDGLKAEKERDILVQTTGFINDLNNALKLNQLTALTAIVFMKRFYVFQSMKDFPPKDLSVAAVLLAIKSEFRHRRADDVLLQAFRLLHHKTLKLNTKEYKRVEEYFFALEGILVPTLGFDTDIQHPHSIIIETCEEMKVPKEQTKIAYALATMSLHVTDWCLRFQPSVVVCVCIYMASNWTQCQDCLFQTTEDWIKRVDKSVSKRLLLDLEHEMLEAMVKFFPKLPKIPAMDAEVLKLMVETSENFSSAKERRISPEMRCA